MPMNQLVKRLAPYGWLLILNTLVYHAALSFDFVNFDDTEYVIRNKYVHQGLTGETIRWAFTTVHAGYWIPLTWLSFMLDHDLYGLNPAGFHATNLILHALNTWLLFAFFFRHTQRRWRSFAVAALFAVHPLHVESVVWVTERKDVLSTLFFLLALHAYPGAVSGSRRARHAILGIVFWVLSLMAKGTAVTLPVLLLLADIWPLNRWRPTDGWRKAFRLAIEKIPLFAISAAFSAVTVWAQNLGGAVGTVEQYPIAVRLANAAISYIRYLYMTFWPMRLAAFYPHPGTRISYPAAGASFAAILVVSAWAWRQAARRPYWPFGWFFYLISLLPMIGIVQVGGQALADRFTYVPLIGVFAALIWTGGDVWSRLAQRLPARAQAPWVIRMPRFVFGVVLAWLGWRAYQQSWVWKDTLTLFHHTLAVTTNNAYPHYNLGAEYFAQGHLDQAAWHFEKAAEINKKDYEALFNLGNIRRLQGHSEEAVKAYRRGLQQAPAWAPLWNNLGLALIDLGRTNEAIAAFGQALECDAHHAEAAGNLGSLYLHAQRHEDAARAFREGLLRTPTNASFHCGLARALAALGRTDEARDHFAESVRLDPTRAATWREHANLELLLGRREEALRLYRRALAVAADDAETLNNLAYALLGSRLDNEVKEAVELAKRACELATPALAPSCMDTLAMALAADGRYAEAADVAERAAAAAGAIGRVEFAERLSKMARAWREKAQ